jgi:hypothetical protein
MTIIDGIEDSNLFRPFFQDLQTWTGWLVFLKALFGLPMTEHDEAKYRALTHREHPPNQQAEEAWLVVGRRGGKSFIVALVESFWPASEAMTSISNGVKEESLR